MAAVLERYQIELIEHSMRVGALKFGIEQKSVNNDAVYVRLSPYFFNAGLLSTGPILTAVGNAYAATIASALEKPDGLPRFQVLFGPAYKGIPFAACTALVLNTSHGIEVGFAYDRKEVKDHGEGGRMVGVSVKGQRVVIVDDVMTAGTAVRAAIDLIKQEGGEVVGIVQCLDREEVGKDGVSSTVREVEELVGKGRIHSILKMRDLIAWLEKNDMRDKMEEMVRYRERYGVQG